MSTFVRRILTAACLLIIAWPIYHIVRDQVDPVDASSAPPEEGLPLDDPRQPVPAPPPTPLASTRAQLVEDIGMMTRRREILLAQLDAEISAVQHAQARRVLAELRQDLATTGATRLHAAQAIAADLATLLARENDIIHAKRAMEYARILDNDNTYLANRTGAAQRVVTDYEKP